MLTHLREALTPYMPPPILALIKKIDENPLVLRYVTHEPSMLILISLVFFYMSSLIIKTFISRQNVLQDLDADEPEGRVLSNVQNEGFKDSVILMGTCGVGKSVLFQKLVATENVDGSQPKVIPTVTSLKANIRVTRDGIRIIDYPGHATLSTKLPSLLLPPSNRSLGDVRVVLVVDSTKSLTETAYYLYHNLLANVMLVNAWKSANRELQILVVCNKNDELGAKNWRRMKIQLRTELEKLKNISSSLSKGGLSSTSENLLSDESDTTGEHFEMSGKSIDLDDLRNNGINNMKLHFISASNKNGDGISLIRTFVQSGEVMNDDNISFKER